MIKFKHTSRISDQSSFYRLWSRYFEINKTKSRDMLTLAVRVMIINYLSGLNCWTLTPCHSNFIALLYFRAISHQSMTKFGSKIVIRFFWRKFSCDSFARIRVRIQVHNHRMSQIVSGREFTFASSWSFISCFIAKRGSLNGLLNQYSVTKAFWRVVFW